MAKRPRLHCVECGKELSYASTWRGAKFCKGCTTRHTWKGRHLSEESKRKLSLSKKGQRPSAEVREKLSAMRMGEGNSFWGKKHTPETIEKMSQAHSGANHPCYRDGRSNLPYTYNYPAIRKMIQDRDDGLCQHPGCYVPEIGRRHDCHHIDRNKTNNDPANLILLCADHHGKTKWGDPDYWAEFYNEVQIARGICKSFTEVTVMKNHMEGAGL